MTDRVRAHSRRTPGGGTARVQQHGRRSRPRSALVSPRHAWSLVKRARRASKRKKTFLAITLGTLAAAEFTSWLVLDTAGFLLMLAGGLAIGAGALAVTVTGRE